MRALVTGYKGFVGRNLVPYLERAGYEIYGVDIADGNDCRDFFRESNKLDFDVVVHLAAIVGGRRTIDYNPLSVATDLSIDAEMFNWFKRTEQSGKLIYFSSSAAYPISLQTGMEIKLRESDINLTDIANPDMTYGWTKLTGEYLTTFLEMEQVVVFRPFSGYGEDQDLDYPFPSFIHRASLLKDPFEIWGDGLQTRDFIHIRDICAAVVRILDLDMYGTFNLGTGVPTDFRKLASIACGLQGYSPKFDFKESEPVGVRYRVADVRKMLNFYIPKISIEEGVERALYEARNRCP